MGVTIVSQAEAISEEVLTTPAGSSETARLLVILVTNEGEFLATKHLMAGRVRTNTSAISVP